MRFSTTVVTREKFCVSSSATLTPKPSKNALDNLKPDSDFHGDRDAALARSRADWLYGMNLTRLCTKIAERNGYNGGPLRIGRVKTPVTPLVVRRDETIEAFTPKPFWVIKAQISVAQGSFPGHVET